MHLHALHSQLTPKKTTMMQLVALVCFSMVMLLSTGCNDTGIVVSDANNAANQIKSNQSKANHSKPQQTTALQKKAQTNTVQVYMPKGLLDLQQAVKDFSEESNINVKITQINADSETLLAQLKKAGKNSIADVVLLDSSEIWSQDDATDWLQAINSKALNTAIHARLRHQHNLWFGLALTPQVIVYNANKLPKTDAQQLVKNYADLAKPVFKGRLCLTSAKKSINQSLVAGMLTHYGQEKTLSVLSGWKQNLAATPYVTDADMLQAMRAGICAIGMMNHAVFQQYKTSQPNTALTALLPHGHTQVSLITAGVLKYAPNPLKALKLIQWLSQKDMQILVNGNSHTYAVVKPFVSTKLLSSLQRAERQALKEQDTRKTKKQRLKERRMAQKKARLAKLRAQKEKAKKAKNKQIAHANSQAVKTTLSEQIENMDDLDFAAKKALRKKQQLATLTEQLTKQPVANMAAKVKVSMTKKQLEAAQALMKQANYN